MLYYCNAAIAYHSFKDRIGNFHCWYCEDFEVTRVVTVNPFSAPRPPCPHFCPLRASRWALGRWDGKLSDDDVINSCKDTLDF